MAKKQGKYRVRVEVQGWTATLTMVNRANEAEVAHRAFDFSRLPENIRQRLLVQGGQTILQQRTSGGSENPRRLDLMEEVFEMWKVGQWEKEREGGGGAPSREDIALAEVLTAINAVRGKGPLSPTQVARLRRENLEVWSKLRTAHGAAVQEVLDRSAQDTDFSEFLEEE
jgi:hypothetical protein